MDRNDSIRQAVILGALLHDIGKFAQRGGVKLDDKGRKDADIFCPKNKFGYPTHTHVILSERYIEDFLGNNWVQSANFALRHHNPSVHEDKIIQLADWLSCGERRDREPEENVGEVKKEPLISIFSQIKIDNFGINEHYSPAISLTKDLIKHFPKKTKEEALSQNPEDGNSFEYQWKEFCKESEFITKDNPTSEILFLRLLYLLEEYTLFIPSSAYRDKPEISLYHHLKSTAAISTCLYDLSLPKEKIDKIISAYQYKDEEILQQEDFLLISGDISGIQDFIYSVTSEHALKGLRGRSFYLQLLSETIARYILDKFNLTLCNLLYCGGGHFLILLPNLPDSQDRIADLYKRINHNLFYAHQGKIGAVITYSLLAYKDFVDNFAAVLEKLGELTAREKKRKFYNIIHEKFFEVYGIGGEHKGCKICGEELEGNYEKCKLCGSFERLSNELKKAKYIEIEKTNGVDLKEKIYDWKDLLGSFGYIYRFVQDKSSWKLTLKLNDTDFLNERLTGYRFEAFYTPVGMLEDIAKKADGLKKYGALRIDIDNLSTIFSKGLKIKTISRMSMLSHLFSLFFSIQIRSIVEKQEYKDRAIVAYSGGDDLFILGAWSILPLIAKEIHSNFQEFVCKHPKITLSGGVYLAPSDNFPVYQAAEEAGKAESIAKRDEKNRISFFDTPLTWGKLKELGEIKDKIVALLSEETSDKKMPRSLLTMLYSSYEEQKLYKDGKISMQRIWRLLYGLKRLVERYFKKEEEQTKLLELRDAFLKDNELKEHLNIAVRWADYLTRKE